MLRASKYTFRSSRSIRHASTALFKVPEPFNEPVLSFEAGSEARAKLQEAVDRAVTQTPDIPLVIGGKRVHTSKKGTQIGPYDGKPVATYSLAEQSHVEDAIEAAMIARSKWSKLSWDMRAAVTLRAADLITGKHRYDVLAATMIGQGKNAYQAEIDTTCELADFLRFNAKYAQDLYSQQPLRCSPGVWNRAEYRALEGFTYAVTPFNFTAIAGNLIGAPALMGNSVVWKPSANAVLSNYLIQQIFEEAGMPDGVINFVPGDAASVTKTVLDSPDFGALHFTGSTAVFQSLYQSIAANLPKYKSYPRIVGETGGKNFHVVHGSANVEHAAKSTVRGAFEYQGQKCSATSRAYVAKSIWPEFKQILVAETEKLTQGNALKAETSTAFMGPVIHERSFDKVSGAIAAAKEDPTVELLTGGEYSKEAGFYIKPTVFSSDNASHSLFSTEFFGPLLAVHVFEDAQYKEVLKTVDTTSEYGLTGGLFARDRAVIEETSQILENAAGNFYINDKSTGAVVGQQWFGGARKSGTDDKAGSQHLLTRFVAVRNIKENFVDLDEVTYPSNH